MGLEDGWEIFFEAIVYCSHILGNSHIFDLSDLLKAYPLTPCYCFALISKVGALEHIFHNFGYRLDFVTNLGLLSVQLRLSSAFFLEVDKVDFHQYLVMNFSFFLVASITLAT